MDRLWNLIENYFNSDYLIHWSFVKNISKIGKNINQSNQSKFIGTIIHITENTNNTYLWTL